MKNVLINLMNNNKKNTNDFIRFLNNNGFSPYDNSSVILTLKLKENKIGYKITLFSLITSILWFVFLITCAAVYVYFFGVSSYGISIILMFIVAAFSTTMCYFLDVKNRERLLLKNFIKEDVRYVCFTIDYKFVVAVKDADTFIIESIYSHMVDRYITNVGWSTSFKVIDERENITEYYEVLSRYTNNYSSPLFAMLAHENDFSYWETNEQLKYYEKHGSDLNYVDDYFIINNSKAAKKT